MRVCIEGPERLNNAQFSLEAILDNWKEQKTMFNNIGNMGGGGGGGGGGGAGEASPPNSSTSPPPPLDETLLSLVFN